jgi:N-methylhydantoinase A/oxoprolinase/acetone carboxylase beta subunit
VTDASLVLGRINADSLLGGRLPPTGACRAHMARERLELDSLAAAEAVIEISNEGMASTIRRVAVERGVDPRDFDLVAFGGAGPLHAAEIAASLGMAGVIVPPHPGLASAFGTLLADRRVDRRWTYYARSDAVDRMNKSAPVYAAGQGNAAALDALLAAGIDVNATYDHSLTLLMWAAGQGHADAVRLLLTRGAKPDMRDDRGLTAIIADGRGFHGRDARS